MTGSEREVGNGNMPTMRWTRRVGGRLAAQVKEKG
jgi:hypothetical protein